MKIYNRYTNNVIFESKKETIKETIIEAIKKGANLGDANLRGANLRDADLRDAYLGCADLGCADLGCADLGGANLVGADLQRVIICNTNFNNSIISYRGKKVKIKFEVID